MVRHHASKTGSKEDNAARCKRSWLQTASKSVLFNLSSSLRKAYCDAELEQDGAFARPQQRLFALPGQHLSKYACIKTSPYEVSTRLEALRVLKQSVIN